MNTRQAPVQVATPMMLQQAWELGQHYNQVVMRQDAANAAQDDDEYSYESEPEDDICGGAVLLQ